MTKRVLTKCINCKYYIFKHKRNDNTKSCMRVNVTNNKYSEDVCDIFSPKINTYDDSKPWHDPDSLFCDTKFLKKLVKKDIRKGKECK